MNETRKRSSYTLLCKLEFQCRRVSAERLRLRQSLLTLDTVTLEMRHLRQQLQRRRQITRQLQPGTTVKHIRTRDINQNVGQCPTWWPTCRI